MVQDPLHRILGTRPIVRPERANQSRHRVRPASERSLDPIATQTIARDTLGIDEHDHDVIAMITESVRDIRIKQHDWTVEGMASSISDHRAPTMHHDLERVMGMSIGRANRPAVQEPPRPESKTTRPRGHILCDITSSLCPGRPRTSTRLAAHCQQDTTTRCGSTLATARRRPPNNVATPLSARSSAVSSWEVCTSRFTRCEPKPVCPVPSNPDPK